MSTQPIRQVADLLGDARRTELLLIRHGRSADLAPGEGTSDPALHPEGHEQARKLAKRLTDKQIDAIYSSDLKRTRATAAPLAEVHGLTVTERPELREVHLGDWEGGELRRLVSTGAPEYLEFVRTGRLEMIPNAEPDGALRARIGAALREIVEAHRNGTVAVVVHLGVINAVIADLVGGPRTMTTNIENTSITVVRVLQDGTPNLVVVNDCHHLYDPVFGAAQ